MSYLSHNPTACSFNVEINFVTFVLTKDICRFDSMMMNTDKSFKIPNDLKNNVMLLQGHLMTKRHKTYAISFPQPNNIKF